MSTHGYGLLYPFAGRLTQNIVDVCGVAGVEGVFMAVSELTLTVGKLVWFM